jgi:AraC family transcriptional regulator, regulatory protein of adaptative response / DNA-3-methyladenine glycosylase II
MFLDPQSCYRALQTHDARFDGRFYVGVSSTRVYCRPVCRVRSPRRENCRFFPSAAAAEVAGFRPCLRCRPELAPGNAGIDASARLAQSAAGLIENGALDEDGVEGLAARVGVTGRHLRRIFGDEFGVSPIEYGQTQRLLLAKRLLTDTALPVTEVALASGFASIRRFNALFRERYRMAPGQLRRHAASPGLPGALTFELCYRPPYDWESMLTFLRDRAIAGVEDVHATGYRRTLAFRRRGERHAGWIDVRCVPKKRALRVVVSPSLARAVPWVLARVKHAFDLGCDPEPIDAVLGDLAASRPGLRVPGTFDGFELAVRAVVGQQITVRAARTLLGRIATAFGETLDGAPDDACVRTFPEASRIAARAPGEIAHLGVVPARARTIVALARAIAGGEIALDPGGDVESTLRRLEAVPGIGPWTAQYVAMRALGWPDAFPAGDLVVLRALDETRPARASARSERWRPWRAYAVIHLWRNAQ